MRKTVIILLQSLLTCLVIVSVKVDLYANASERTVDWNTPGITYDNWGFPIPPNSSLQGDEQLIQPKSLNFDPEGWYTTYEVPFITVQRNFDDQNTNHRWLYFIPPDTGSNTGQTKFVKGQSASPNTYVTIKRTVKAQEVGLTKFTGWAQTPSQYSWGKKRQQHKVTVNTNNGIAASARWNALTDMWRSSEPLIPSPTPPPSIWPNDGSGETYLMNSVPDQNGKFWGDMWDTWWGNQGSGWDENSNVNISVSFTNSDTVAVITRKVLLGTQGYTNFPLEFHKGELDDFSNDESVSKPPKVPSTNGYYSQAWQNNEGWLHKYGTVPQSTNSTAVPVHTGGEWRLYGIGPKVYLYGVSIAGAHNNVNFYLSIEDPDSVNHSDWTRSPVLQKTFKSGYGIPLVAEVRGFNYVDVTKNQGHDSYFTNFKIQPDSTVSISNTTLDSKIIQPDTLKNFDLIDHMPNGDNDFERYFIKQNSYSPYKYRKLYSAATQADSQPNSPYTITVTAHIHAKWDNNTWDWWYNTGYPNYIDVYHYVAHPQDTWYTNPKSAKIDIKGSMFDDDSRTVEQ